MAQDVRNDRHLIHATLVIGNSSIPAQNENYSDVETFLKETNPDLGLGLNLTIRSGIASEQDLNQTSVLIVGLPFASTIPNGTALQRFLARGGSLFLMSDYNGGGSRNSSEALNNILSETYVSGVSFSSDAITISNSTQNWQERVYQNDSLAVRVNSTMFNVTSESASVTAGVTQAVVAACSLNVTTTNPQFEVGVARAPSDSGLPTWLALFDNGTNRIVLSGSASMFNNTYLNVEGNRLLFRNLILWLVEKFQTSSPNLFAPIIIVSSAVLVCGLVVYVSSRKRRI
jgi:hypothetical protein